MTDKQDAHSDSFSLPGWQLLEVAGAHAAAFLQAQTMNDVRALAAGHWQWNGWLNPKGRVIALFALAALDADRYWLVAPDFPAAELASRLQRFVFRSKVKLRVREDVPCIFGAFATATPRTRFVIAWASRMTQGMTRTSIELDLGGEDGARTVLIAASEATHDASMQAPGDRIPDAVTQGVRRWSAFDLAHGLPRLASSQSEAWTPQMLSLDRLNAYSLKKGCYPGQEIVARTHYLGQAKRVLARIEGSGLTNGAEIVAADRTLGSIVSRVGDEALAVLAADRPTDGWECAGLPCRELLSLGGDLARWMACARAMRRSGLGHPERSEQSFVVPSATSFVIPSAARDLQSEGIATSRSLASLGMTSYGYGMTSYGYGMTSYGYGKTRYAYGVTK